MKIDRAYFDAVIDRAGTACEKWDGRQEVFRPQRRHPPLGGRHGLCLRPVYRRGAQGARRPPHLRLYGRCGGKPSGGGKLPQAPLWPDGGAGVDPSQPQRGGQHALFPLRADRAGRARAHPAAGVRPLPRDGAALRPRRGGKPASETAEGWKMDFASLEAAFQSGVRCMFLCSPHNPVGRVWTRAELEQLTSLVKAYKVRVIADEIHASFTFAPHVHTPLRTLLPDAIMLTSATKAFNIAGLRQSSIIVSDEEARAALQKEMHSVNADHPNLFAMVAQRAALRGGRSLGWTPAWTTYAKTAIWPMPSLPSACRKWACTRWRARILCGWTCAKRASSTRRSSAASSTWAAWASTRACSSASRAGAFSASTWPRSAKNVQAGLEGIERALRA